MPNPSENGNFHLGVGFQDRIDSGKFWNLRLEMRVLTGNFILKGHVFKGDTATTIETGRFKGETLYCYPPETIEAILDSLENSYRVQLYLNSSRIDHQLTEIKLSGLIPYKDDLSPRHEDYPEEFVPLMEEIEYLIPLQIFFKGTTVDKRKRDTKAPPEETLSIIFEMIYGESTTRGRNVENELRKLHSGITKTGHPMHNYKFCNLLRRGNCSARVRQRCGFLLVETIGPEDHFLLYTKDNNDDLKLHPLSQELISRNIVPYRGFSYAVIPIKP